MPIIATFMKKAWEFAKPYRSYIFTVLITVAVVVVGLLVLKRKTDSIVDAMVQQQKVHDEQLKKIEEATIAERKAHEENVARLMSSLAEVQKRHDDDMRALDEKKSKQVNQLVQKFKDDPNGMAKQISDITGFQLVIPSE